MSSPRFPWWPVAIWEFYRTVVRKDFLISILLVPVFAVGVAFFTAWLEDCEEGRMKRVAVAWTDQATGAPQLPELEGFAWVPLEGDSASREAIRERLESKDIEGAVLLPTRYAFDGGGELLVRRLDSPWKRSLERHLTGWARVERAAERGLTEGDLEAIDERVVLAESSPLPQPSGKGERIVGAVVVIFLLLTIFVTGAYMGIGITGEKQARVTEVIISAVSPQAWIDGKILAYTAIGLLQAGIWGLSGALFLIFSAWAFPETLRLTFLPIAFAYAILGLLFYTSFFAFIYATIKDLQSTSKFQAYLYFLPFIPIIVLDPAISNPEALYIVLLSLFPPFAPMLMPMRFAIGGAALWEVGVGLLLLAAATYGMRRLAGQAFRIGMLMYGKELSLPELLRWAKES